MNGQALFDEKQTNHMPLLQGRVQAISSVDMDDKRHLGILLSVL